MAAQTVEASIPDYSVLIQAWAILPLRPLQQEGNNSRKRHTHVNGGERDPLRQSLGVQALHS